MSQTSLAHDLFVTGLKNAHAMENQALSIMRPQCERLEHYRNVEQQLELHIRETEGQIARLDQLLGGEDSGASSLKDTFQSAFGTMAALGHTVAEDEIIKNSLANHAFENYEIAAYRVLIASAEASGETAAVPLLQQSLEEERRMATWIESHLPEVTNTYLALKASGTKASV